MKKKVMLAIIGMALSAIPSILNAQCSYDLVRTVCHAGTTTTTGACCAWVWPLGGDPTCLTPGSKTETTSDGFVNTCGAGSTVQTLDGSYTTSCNWTVSGVDCGVPYGPTGDSADTTAVNCTGTCQ